MGMLITDDQREIKAVARELLSRRCTTERVVGLATDRAADESLWREFVELGWPGISVPEEHGGLGFGLVESVLLAEESGYALAATPLSPTLGAALVIGRAGSKEQRVSWLPKLGSGEIIGAVGLRTASAAATLVPEVPRAAVVVLLSSDGRGTLLDHSLYANRPLDTIDRTRTYGLVTGDGESMACDVGDATACVQLIWAGELLGICQRMLDDTVAFVRDREQFGSPVGAYQAAAHRCADMLIDIEGARSAVYGAAAHDAAGSSDLVAYAAMTARVTSEAAKRVTASAIQAHGGIGFTWEAGLHRWLRRAQATIRLLGPPDRHADIIATWTRHRALAEGS